MISWIVASHDASILADNLAATLTLKDDDELIVIRDAPTIAVAYNEGALRAVQPIKVYVHHDVRIRDLGRLRVDLATHVQPWVGIVGIIGSRTRAVPYWDGSPCGSVDDARIGRLGSGRGGEAAYLDGLLLATAQDITWDEAYPGWHWYDHDVCAQMLAQGLPNWCLSDGHTLVFHNTASTGDPDELPGYHEGMTRFRRKWGQSLGLG